MLPERQREGKKDARDKYDEKRMKRDYLFGLLVSQYGANFLCLSFLFLLLGWLEHDFDGSVKNSLNVLP